jgi:hypothetical protein
MSLFDSPNSPNSPSFVEMRPATKVIIFGAAAAIVALSFFMFIGTLAFKEQHSEHIIRLADGTQEICHISRNRGNYLDGYAATTLTCRSGHVIFAPKEFYDLGEVRQ